jgi:hypothetical protein
MLRDNRNSATVCVVFQAVLRETDDLFSLWRLDQGDLASSHQTGHRRRVRNFFLAMVMRFGCSFRNAYPGCGGPEGEKHEYFLVQGRPEMFSAFRK